jgi:NAD-dependent SIR2 family protein deacetylase
MEYDTNMNKEILDLIEGSDIVLIGIGEAFERRDLELETVAYKMLQKEDPLLAGFQRLRYWKEHPDSRVMEAYNRLYDLVKDKDYFIVTTCMDDRIYESCFSNDRITAPCGTWRYLQCSDCCNDELLPVTEMMIENNQAVFCPKCNARAVFNQVTAEKYNEAGYMAQWVAYRNWLQRTINRNVCILELGVGMKYPTIIRWPFEKIAFCNQKSSFIRVHKTLFQLSEELHGKGNSIKADPIDFLLE